MIKKDYIDKLCLEYSDCQKCPFGRNVYVDKTPKRVFYKGNTEGRVGIIGEGPGRDEIEEGIPFVGRCGKKLSEILKFAEIDEKDCFITNTFICSEDGVLKPTNEVLQACNPRLKLMIEIVAPSMIITLGFYAIKAMFGIDAKLPMKSWLGKVHVVNISGRLVPVITEYHPSYYLRNPSAKKEAYDRWKKIGAIYKSLSV